MSAALSIDELFIQAIAISDLRERENYLNAACAGDSEKREQIAKLLAVASQLGSFLETPVNALGCKTRLLKSQPRTFAGNASAPIASCV